MILELRFVVVNVGDISTQEYPLSFSWIWLTILINGERKAINTTDIYESGFPESNSRVFWMTVSGQVYGLLTGYTRIAIS